MTTIIFDCDGTLVDSEPLSNQVLIETVAEHGLVLSLAEAVASFRGRSMEECIAQLEGRLGRPLPTDFVPRLRARTADAFRRRLRPVQGALELVRSLSQSICVASSGPLEKIELSLSVVGLLPFFQGRMFSSYEIGSWKPAPDLFLHVARTMGVPPADCAVVEDSLPGIRAGVAAGMRVFAFQPDGVDPALPAGVTVVKDLLDLRTVFARNATNSAANRPRSGADA